jgi:dihydroorotate dehydrogenase
MNVLISSATSFCYAHGLKPLFFRFDPEQVHNLMVSTGEKITQFPLLLKGMKSSWSVSHPKLHKKLDGILFPNPIGLSAGFDYNGKLTQVLPAVGFGFHTIGTVTLHAYAGNPKPRLLRLPRSKSLVVNKGLKNDGARTIIHRLENLKFRIPVGISIASTNMAFLSEREQMNDILECFQLFERSKVRHAYYELNISCPNTYGGEPFTTPSKLESLMSRMDTLKLKRPLYIKMPIDQSEKETGQLLKVLAKHKVHGVIIGNLTKDKTNPAVDKNDRVLWRKSKGNLSGKPTWERSNLLISYTRKHFKDRFTIIGTGGVFNGPDAQEKLALGADLVQLITGMIFQGPQVIGQINHHLLTA